MGTWKSKLKHSDNISDNIDVLEEAFTNSLIEAAENTLKKTVTKLKQNTADPGGTVNAPGQWPIDGGQEEEQKETQHQQIQ